MTELGEFRRDDAAVLALPTRTINNELSGHTEAIPVFQIVLIECRSSYPDGTGNMPVQEFGGCPGVHKQNFCSIFESQSLLKVDVSRACLLREEGCPRFRPFRGYFSFTVVFHQPGRNSILFF